ncbi:VPLPA-CTERM sorting domain-containing protein [Primorskyibacter sp. S187A]|uniref:VPLPA-CTERM sorting domain-containing protein n=1 Tax=Primorskyibacter sp. S187A TaxID=3415130 RepID=UPI003C7D1972
MSIIRILAALALTFVTAVGAQAAQITFIHTTLDASGTINGEVFGTSDVTITATGDTNNIQSFGSGFFINHASASIEILGVGTFDFLSPTRTFVNNANEVVGFSREGANGNDLLNGPEDSIFSSWDMTTSIGPVTGDLEYLQWTNSPVETDAGTLVFNNATVFGSFEAIVAPVPLPAAGWLMIAGIGGLAAMRRNRKS